jgi:hypothetical protein
MSYRGSTVPGMVSPATEPATTRAHGDAAKAWSFALGLDDGGQPRPCRRRDVAAGAADGR